jgi:hypothetical protein
MDRKQIAQYHCTVNGRLVADRSRLVDKWNKVLEYTFPMNAILQSDPSMASFRKLFDVTGMEASERFVAGMYNNISPPGQRTMILVPPAGSNEAKDRQFERFLSDKSETLHAAWADSNFHTEMEQTYQGYCGIGTSCMSVRKSKKRPFTFSTRTPTEFTFSVDEDQEISTVGVTMRFTAREAVNRFGFDRVSKAIQDAYSSGSAERAMDKHPFLNVSRTLDSDQDSLNIVKGWPVESLWIDLVSKEIVAEGGNRCLRQIVSRFRRVPGINWGYGPGQKCYPWIRMVNKMLEIFVKYADKQMDPPLIAPDDGSFGPLVTVPGGVIYARAGAGDRFKPEYLQLTGRHELSLELLKYYVEGIGRSMFNDLFSALNDGKERTATEFINQYQSQLSLLAPSFGRIMQEFFRPMSKVSLGLLEDWQNNTIAGQYAGQTMPEFPYDLEMISPIGLAMKWNEVKNLSNFYAVMSPFAEVDPQVWDHYNLSELSLMIGEAMAIPSKIRRSITEVRAIQERRAQIQAQQQELDAQQQQADVISKLSKVPQGQPQGQRMSA